MASKRVLTFSTRKKNGPIEVKIPWNTDCRQDIIYNPADIYEIYDKYISPNFRGYSWYNMDEIEKSVIALLRTGKKEYCFFKAIGEVRDPDESGRLDKSDFRKSIRSIINKKNKSEKTEKSPKASFIENDEEDYLDRIREEEELDRADGYNEEE